MLSVTAEAYSDQKLVFVLAALMFFAIPIRYPDPETRTQREFKNFITIYNRTYSGNESEYQKRYQIFKDTFEMLEDYRQDSQPVFGINRYSDMSSSEFRQMYFPEGNPQRTKRQISKSQYSKDSSTGLTPLPQRVDWREHGIVTPIRNQRGFSYAHAVIGCIESVRAVKHRSTAHELSVQQMIDCCGNSETKAKNGDTCHLLQWLAKGNITILPEQYYPISDGIEACRTTTTLQSPSNGVVGTARVTDYASFTFVGREPEMLAYLAFKGPLIAAVNALPWQYYVGGVIKSNCNGPPNHAVQIVGYNLDERLEVPHFIVRNSWGITFGHCGYAKIAIGGNVCGIAEEVSAVAVVD